MTAPLCRKTETLPAGSARRLDLIRAEQARRLFRETPTGVVFAAIGASVLALGLMRAGSINGSIALGWTGLIWACALAHLGLCARYNRAAPEPATIPKWLNLFCLFALVEGLAWALGAVLMVAPDSPTQVLLVLLVYVAIASGGLFVYGTYLPAYLLFFFPTILSHFGLALAWRHPFALLLAVLVLTYVAMMSVLGVRWSGQLAEQIRLEFENAALLDGFRIEKDRADAANIAKSRFLAAASHDLRQPVHALGLFIGALRSRRMDKEARQLVDHIDRSVGAMDDLFAALLDISKLDAGVVEARLQPMRLQPLLDRLIHDYGAEAARKGLALRMVPSNHVVHSDPALLERVVRNILGNAVRYTERGRVVVGCRRAEAQVRLEIHDSGPGISPTDQARIFEEFLQLGNPERDRTKGLGLGLAIVRRTLPLVGATLDLDSVVGRGSVFRLSIPRATAPLPPATQAMAGFGSARTGALIVVVDDEQDIREGMVALLGAWGYRTLTGGSADDILRQLAMLSEKPALLICDYRLRHEMTGAAAIREVRGFLGSEVPALLITGDTAPERIAEAQASGFPLLHKPVPNARLRAAIGNLLR